MNDNKPAEDTARPIQLTQADVLDHLGVIARQKPGHIYQPPPNPGHTCCQQARYIYAEGPSDLVAHILHRAGATIAQLAELDFELGVDENGDVKPILHPVPADQIPLRATWLHANHDTLRLLVHLQYLQDHGHTWDFCALYAHMFTRRRSEPFIRPTLI